VTGKKAEFRQPSATLFVKIRMTMLSPWFVGKQDHAQVDQFAARRSLNAPSCGIRCSEIDMLDWILSRLMNRGLQPFGWSLHFVQHAVDAVAHAKSFRQRLQVDIRSAHFEGFGDQRIDQLDQWGIGIHHRAIIRPAGGDLDVVLGQFLDGFCRFGSAARPPRSP